MSEEIRDNVSDLINETLCGPLDGDNETLTVPPTDFYTTGILYPQEDSTPSSPSPVDDEGATSGGVQNDLEPEEVGAKTGKHQKSSNTKDKLSSSEEIDELLLTTEFKPSAFGISVITDVNSHFKLNLTTAKYNSSIKEDYKEEADKRERAGKKIPNSFKNFTREKIEKKDLTLKTSRNKIQISTNDGKLIAEGDYKAEFKLHENEEIIAKCVKRQINRKEESSLIITITLVNDKDLDNQNDYVNDPENLYFQPNIIAYSSEPIFKPFDNYSNLESLTDEEAINNKLLYRNYLSFGSGHGCAVDWASPEDDNFRTTKIYSQIIPEHKVLGNEFEPQELIDEETDCEVLYMKRLAGAAYTAPEEEATSQSQIISELHDFVDAYEGWIVEQEEDVNPSINKLNTTENNKQILKERARKNLDTCQDLVARMREGIKILNDKDSYMFQAFCEANRAMFMQRSMNQFVKERKEKTEKIYPGHHDEPLPDFKNKYHFKNKDEYLAKWRPFQLAFLLSQIKGVKDPSSKDRETVDLLWFSTGGGKTEAYMGLIALVIFYRRLRSKYELGDPDKGAGVTAFMRYTLRLLNKQQFNRAAPLICSCEIIRREKEELYGQKEISLGIWVGSSLTPNKWGSKSKGYGFYKSFSSLRKDPSNEVEYSLPLFECPCCGTRLIQEKVEGEVKGEWGITGEFHRGNYYEKPPFYLFCPNSKCYFHIDDKNRRDFDYVKKNKIPIYFVDDEIYKAQPTLIFATVDKFASINWNDDCYNLFNINLNKSNFTNSYPPPELIIQDELHLINAALGTIYGIYEIAIDELCKTSGVKPKIVAATATARNAEKQCKLLYGREKFLQFPPPGLSIDDSFYSRTKEEDNTARKYLGFQASGFTNTVAQIRLVGMLMQRTPTLDYPNKKLDDYYTLLVYFNTLRELGKFRTLIEDDIVAYKKFLSKVFDTANIGFREDKIHELSSALNADEINQVLENLEKAELPTNNGPNADVYHKLGFRTKEDLEFLRKSKYGWFKYEGNGDDVNYYGEFPKKFNKQGIFEDLNLEFSEGSSLESLTANKQRFEKDFETTFQEKSEACQVVSATNMISVGIDLPRLNIMQVTGQPRSHSEYIQASSRVGRDKPGVVITTYNPAKNRDRSHYERFTDYHQAFYKDVEATTVTPYSLPALEKALPAVIFSLMKCFHYGDSKKAAWDFNAQNTYQKIHKKIKKRVQKTYESIALYDQKDLENALEAVDQVFKEIQEKWIELDNKYGDKLKFSSFNDYYPNFQKEKVFRSLYIKSDHKIKLDERLSDRPTCMTSLRNVEAGSEIKIKTQF